jgi:hypothetical protein
VIVGAAVFLLEARMDRPRWREVFDSMFVALVIACAIGAVLVAVGCGLGGWGTGSHSF